MRHPGRPSKIGNPDEEKIGEHGTAKKQGYEVSDPGAGGIRNPEIPEIPRRRLLSSCQIWEINKKEEVKQDYDGTT